IYRAQISRDYFLNFADADPNAGVDAGMVYRYGKDIRDRDMTDFGAFYRRPSGEKPGGGFMFFRKLFALFMQDELRQATQRLPLLKEVWLPDLEVMVARDAGGSTDGFYLAAKGGHNAESHNHNDVGSYVVFYDGLPLLIDVGRGTYTARTFSSRRYEIWYNNSDYHNLPSINGQTQVTGRDGKASGVSYKPGKPFAEFSLDLAKAYPEKTGVNSWKRTVRLNRGKGVQVKDVTDLREAVSVTQHLMTCYPAEVARPGEVVIHYGTKEGQTLDFMVKYDPGQMRAAVEKVRLETEEDEGIRAKWGDVIHRINFDVLSPKKKDTYVFEIRRKP
ncbi:MAG: heparinase II/III-family protein, partial [Tannerella sp.]|nr:heparinase II/III-family protein [Tannerella sp.]